MANADDIAARILTDLELAGIKIQPDNRWQEVKQAITAALLDFRREGRKEMKEEAAKECDITASAWRDINSGYADVLAAQARAIRELKEE